MTQSGTAMRTRGRTLFIATSATVVAAVLTIAGSAHADDAVTQCIAASDKGLDLRKQGKLVEARKTFATCVNSACGADISDTCEKRIAEINGALPTIIFAPKDGAGTDLVGVKVTIDGVALADPLDGRALTVDPGKHTFKFEARGQAPVEKDFVLREAEKDRRETIVIGPAPAVAPSPSGGPPSVVPPAVTSPPPAPPPASSWSTQKTVAVVVGGIGVLGVGAGAVTGLIASSRWSSAKSDCGSGCGPNDPAQGERNDARRAATTSTIEFISGGAVVVGAVVLWFTAPRGGSATPAPTTGVRVQITPSIGAGSGALIVRGAF